jgi:TorA maturation chaperone TorD
MPGDAPADEVARQVAEGLSRAGLARLLARAFTYPTPDVVAELAQLADQMAMAPGAPESLRAGVARFAIAAREADPAPLADEYGFLFDRQVRCPPYEGAYGPLAPMAAGKAAALADIAGFYAAFGLQPAEARADAEDHLAAELEFMSALALKEAYAAAEGHEEGRTVTRDAARAFLTDHLGRWAEMFADRLRQATPLPYYTAAAELLAAWVRHETEALGATPLRFAELAQTGPAEADVFTCPKAETDPEG